MDFLWIFGCGICYIIVLFKCITNLKTYKHCFIKVDLQKHFCITGWCLVRQRNPQARPYGFKNLYLRDFHLCILIRQIS
jgi:hypothetical protein